MNSEDLGIQLSDGCIQWLQHHHVSLVISTYQIGKILSIGHKQDGKYSAFERTFDRCMGMCLTQDGNGFYLSCKNQIWRFENILQQGEVINDYDKLYVPQSSSTTGDCHIHDLTVDKENKLVFVNTLFNCLATTSEINSFRPYWKPSFINKLVPEDRCHLNGLANREGKPFYVTVVGCSDEREGWRQLRGNGGVVIDITNNEIVSHGLSMPHSPRWYRESLWICNAGTGEFGRIDTTTGQFEPLAFCPGFMRGLAFCKNYAIIRVSKPRGNQLFNGLELNSALLRRDLKSICGILIINLYTGLIEHTIKFTGIVDEIYDVICIERCSNPMLIGLRGDEINHTISIER